MWYFINKDDDVIQSHLNYIEKDDEVHIPISWKWQTPTRSFAGKGWIVVSSEIQDPIWSWVKFHVSQKDEEYS